MQIKWYFSSSIARQKEIKCTSECGQLCILVRSKSFVVEGNLTVLKFLICVYPWIFDVQEFFLKCRKICIGTENDHQHGIKLWCIHSIGYYTAIKNSDVLQTYIYCNGNWSLTCPFCFSTIRNSMPIGPHLYKIVHVYKSRQFWKQS